MSTVDIGAAMTEVAASMANTSLDEFFTRGALFKTYTIPVSDKASPATSPKTFARECRSCRRETTWQRKNSNEVSPGYIHRFACAACDDDMLTVWVMFEKAEKVGDQNTFYMRKLGATEIPVQKTSRALAKLMGDEADLYRKALACMGAGFGLGAVSYLRRIIEDRGDTLIGKIRDWAKEANDEEALARLDQAALRQEGGVRDRLKVVAELLPKSLRPGNINPLSVLYGSLSEQVHASESDDEALARATELQWAFDVLVRRMAEDHEELAQYRHLMTKESGRQ